MDKQIKIEKNDTSDEDENLDEDVVTEAQLSRLFTNKYEIITEKALSLNDDYILHLSCTSEPTPKICAGLSNQKCEIYNLTENQLTRTATINVHTTNITNVKFNLNGTLLYTGSVDGIKLWDLREPLDNAINFIDSSEKDRKLRKPLTTFDVSSNERLLCAGSELINGDAFLLFWDIRNTKLMGGYWESHTDDITKVLFHPNKSNTLASGSTDGLINIYDLMHASESNALRKTFNTESSVGQLLWYKNVNRDSMCCVTHTDDIQLWDVQEATRSAHFWRNDISEKICRSSEDNCYVANVHRTKNPDDVLLLAGSNKYKGKFESLVIQNNTKLLPNFQLMSNKQRIRCSWYNSNINLLITGGEQGFLSVWKPMTSNSTTKTTLKDSSVKQKLHVLKKPY